MAHQNYHNQYNNGWRSPSNEYQVYETVEEASYPIHHHNHKGRVAFRSNSYEEPPRNSFVLRRAESESVEESNYQRARLGDDNAFKSVDQEADAFIHHEHNRMELAKFMSMRPNY